MTPRLSVQLYSVRNELNDDFDQTLGALASYGYRHVEPFGVENFVDQLADGLAKHGLDAPTTHANVLGESRPAIIDAAQRLGVGLVVQPSSPREAWESVEGIQGLAEQLNKAAAELSAFGMQVGYHNHEFELQARHDGTTGLEILADALDPAVKLEVDTYWAHVGGEDVPALLQRLGERVVAIHIKDGDGTKNNKNQVAVGAGEIPVMDYVDAAPSITDGVVELDDTSGVMLDAVRDSHAWLSGKRDWA